MTTITVTVVGSEPDMLNEQTRLHLSCGCYTSVPTSDEESLSFIGSEVRDHECTAAQPPATTPADHPYGYCPGCRSHRAAHIHVRKAGTELA